MLLPSWNNPLPKEVRVAVGFKRSYKSEAGVDYRVFHQGHYKRDI